MENLSWKRHGKVLWKWCVIEASWKILVAEKTKYKSEYITVFVIVVLRHCSDNIMWMKGERQRRYIDRLNADPMKRAEYLMKDRMRKKKNKDLWSQHGSGYAKSLPETKGHCETTQQETRCGEITHAKQLKQSYDMCCVMPLCHPFTAVVSGPTACGKTAWVMRLIGNVNEKIDPVPARIWYYYGEHQSVFNEWPFVHFEEGLPKLSDEVFDGREPSMIVIDDHMSDVN